jgi:hypothetical protein
MRFTAFLDPETYFPIFRKEEKSPHSTPKKHEILEKEHKEHKEGEIWES